VKEGNESVTNCNQLKLVSPKEVIYTRGDPPLTFNLKTLTQNLPLSQILPIFTTENVIKMTTNTHPSPVITFKSSTYTT
jgi:hypothetical protein